MKNEYYVDGDIIHIIFHSKTHGYKEALIDKSDLSLIENARSWGLRKGNNTFYTQHWDKKEKRLVSMHTYILNNPVGTWIDHWDHNGLNNTRSNIFIVTPRQNAHNKINNAVFIGVKENPNGYFSSRINIQNTLYALPSVKDAKQAAFCYNTICMILGDTNIYEVSLNNYEKENLLHQLKHASMRERRNKVSSWLIHGLIVLLEHNDYEKFTQYIRYAFFSLK